MFAKISGLLYGQNLADPSLMRIGLNIVGRHMTDEPSLNEVYRKFGEVSEAAQLLETELGNLLFLHKGGEADLFETKNPDAAARILEQINRNTLGQLLW